MAKFRVRVAAASDLPCIVRVKSYGRHSSIKWGQASLSVPQLCSLHRRISAGTIPFFKWLLKHQTTNHSLITMRFFSWLTVFAMLLGFVSAFSIPEHQRRSVESDDSVRLVFWLDHLRFSFLTMNLVFLQGQEHTTAQRRVVAAVWSLMGATAPNAKVTMTVPTTVENSFLNREVHVPHALLKASTIYDEVTL